MPRPCRCDRFRPGEPFDPALDCQNCYLWHTHTPYRVRHGGGTSAPPPPADRPGPGPCPHLGPPTGETSDCPSCRGSVRLKVMGCAVHGACTVSREVAGLACCKGCPDRPAKALRRSFRHGLGDATNFAHMLPLYARRGYRLEVAARSGEGAVFAAGGADPADGDPLALLWSHPPAEPVRRWPRPWVRNKNGFNLLAGGRLPRLPGDPADLWREYAAVRLDLSGCVAAADRASVDQLLADAPRPWVACHHRGWQSGSHRDYPDEWAVELWRLLRAEHGGTVVVLDRDGRGAKCGLAGVRYLRGFGVGELYEVLRRADVLVGIDSGPLNFVRFTDTPAVGIWNVHYPSDFFLPREATLHVVANRHAGRDRWEREYWNTALAPDDGPSPEYLATVVGRVLAGPKYLGPGRIARDVQLQTYIGRTDSAFRHDFGHRVNRHETFGRALAFLAGRSRPVVVETGCIRAEEDWAGAGFSTYLFGAFLARHGGALHSADLTPAHVAFAREWTREFGCVTVHQEHSHRFLDGWAGRPIDLLYCDSADTDTDGYQDVCLGEVRRALPRLAPDARILIDDTPPAAGGGWRGKGGLAVPWLLGLGWRVEYAGWQVLLGPPGLPAGAG